jgi:hypothetical protein
LIKGNNVRGQKLNLSELNSPPLAALHWVAAIRWMALDNGGSTPNGGTVWQWTPQSGNTNQEWQLVGVGTGYRSVVYGRLIPAPMMDKLKPTT